MHPVSIPQPTASDCQAPIKSKKHYPTTLGLENLNLLGNLRRSSSQSQKSPPPAKEGRSIDIADQLLPSPMSPSPSWGLGRSKSMSRMRRTLSLEADAVLAPLPRDKVVKMRRWILSLAVVNFDLDIGPVVDVLYPEATMSASERENIAFSSFPDSAIFDSGSDVHSFRLRDPTSSSQSSPSSLSLEASPSGDGFIYGFALFHQRRDSSSKRGYLQRSVVILSQHVFPALFTACLAELAPMYFARGAPALETACHNIANWPDPTPGLACELGFMGSVLSVELPLASPHHQLRQTSSLDSITESNALAILASLPSEPSVKLPSPLRLFAHLLPKLWSLWEVLVLSEPVVLFAKCPRDASLAVWWLMELLKPLPLAIDFRPYFHIHDVDFDRLLGPSAAQASSLAAPNSSKISREIQNQTQSPKGVLLGVTNPFFENICKRWPHIVSLGQVQAPSISPQSEALTQNEAATATANGSGGLGRTSKDMRHSSSGSKSFPIVRGRSPSRHSRRVSAAGAKGGGAMQLGPVAGLHSRHQRYINKDREILKVLEDAVGKGGEMEARAVQQLRLHFARRASEVLVPLNRYCTALISSSSSTTVSSAATSSRSLSLSSSKKDNTHPPPSLPSFHPSAFFASLKQNGSPLPFRSRSKQKEFYERWLKSPAFGVWMRERDEEFRTVLATRA